MSRILVVDDSETVLSFLRTILENEQYRGRHRDQR